MSDAEPLELVLATANPDKAAEITAILGGIPGLVVLPRPPDVPDVDETGTTLEENAALKALALCQATGRPSVADDTGLEVEALDGAPGVYSARYAGPDATYAQNVDRLLHELGDRPADARRACFRTVALAAFPDGRLLVATGEVAGHIATRRSGESGFGYDPVFIPEEGDGRTFAEMSPEEKHAVSHRGRAFRELGLLLADLTADR